MWKLYPGLLLVAMLGCGQEPAKEGQPAREPEGKTEAKGLKPLPLNSTLRYRGMSIAEWARRLDDASWDQSHDTQFVMQDIGEEAVPYLLDVIEKSKIPHARANALRVLQARPGSKYRDWISPALCKALKDPSTQVRATAAGSIWPSGYPECLAALREAEKVEPNSEIKKIMNNFLNEAAKLAKKT